VRIEQAGAQRAAGLETEAHDMVTALRAELDAISHKVLSSSSLLLSKPDLSNMSLKYSPSSEPLHTFAK
jgi:hypothetical protein